MQSTETASRGRGRGGVPVLPEGMWDLLQGNVPSDRKLNGQSSVVHESALDTAVDEKTFRDAVPTDQETILEQSFMLSGFGREKRRRTAAAMGGRATLERDMKGKDWECMSCFNLNWSWRSTCNKCGATKFVNSSSADSDVRDGAGRGFNERQDRISAATVEIDEEGFDDFGRRVKKLSRTDRRAKEEAALQRLGEKYRHLLPASAMTTLFTTADDVISDEQSHHDSLLGKEERSSDSTKADSRYTKVNNNSKEFEEREGGDRVKDRDSRDRIRDRDGADRARDRDGGVQGDRIKGRDGADRVRDRDGGDRVRDRDGADRLRDWDGADRLRDRDGADRVRDLGRERGERSRSRDRYKRSRP